MHMISHIYFKKIIVFIYIFTVVTIYFICICTKCYMLLGVSYVLFRFWAVITWWQAVLYMLSSFHISHWVLPDISCNYYIHFIQGNAAAKWFVLLLHRSRVPGLLLTFFHMFFTWVSYTNIILVNYHLV